MNRYMYLVTIIFCGLSAFTYNNCANKGGNLDGSFNYSSSEDLQQDPPIEPPPPDVPPPPPPGPPPNTPAYVTRVTPSVGGAVVDLSGPVQALRYFYNNSNGNINLVGPFTSSYTMNFVWPEPATTFACFQAMGTDGVWRGPITTNPADVQQCHSVP